MYRNDRPRLNSIQATDGAASAKRCSHQLCRVATEVEHSSIDDTYPPATDGSCSSSSAAPMPLPLPILYPAGSDLLPSSFRSYLSQTSSNILNSDSPAEHPKNILCRHAPIIHRARPRLIIHQFLQPFNDIHNIFELLIPLNSLRSS